MMEINLLNIRKIVVPNKQNFGDNCSSKNIEYIILCDTNEILILKYHKYNKFYENEKNVLIKLNNESFTPKLKYYDDKNLILATTYCGKALSTVKNFNFKPYEQEFINMINIIYNKYGLFHNDIRDKNICIDDNNKLYIIDFDNTSKNCVEQKYMWGYYGNHGLFFINPTKISKGEKRVLLKEGNITFKSTVNKWKKC